MTNIEEAIKLMNGIQKDDEKSKITLEKVSKRIQDANSQIGELLKRVRLEEENKRAILHDLYEISSTLIDATSDIIFS